MKRLMISNLIPWLVLFVSYSQPSHFHGVIVGTNTAPGEDNLRYAVSDAIAVRDALVQNLGWSNGQFYVLTSQSAYRGLILDKIAAMPKDTDTDLFYYAGHGDPQGLKCYDGNYLTPMDLQSEFGTSYSKYSVYIDACASGIFVNYMQQTGVICSACQSDEPAKEDTLSLHAGVFSYYLVQGLTNRAAGGSDGIVTAEELFSYAQTRAASWNQHPQWSDNYYAGNLVLDPAPAAPQGISISGTVGQHPTVSWSPNSEPDLAGYKIYRKVTPDESQFSLVATTSQISWTDAYVTIRTGGTGGQYAYYYVKAYDASSNLSDASSTVYKPITNYNPPQANHGDSGLPKILVKPTEFALEQNQPNPFNPSTRIAFSVPEPAQLKIVVLDLLGREIMTLTDQFLSPSYQTLQWHGTDASGKCAGSGVYFCRMTAQGTSGKQFVKTVKMTLIK